MRIFISFHGIMFSLIHLRVYEFRARIMPPSSVVVEQNQEEFSPQSRWLRICEFILKRKMEKKEKTSTTHETQRGSLQDKNAEEYLREGENIEDMPTVSDQEIGRAHV